jgi:hypothetical protein
VGRNVVGIDSISDFDLTEVISISIYGSRKISPIIHPEIVRVTIRPVIEDFFLIIPDPSTVKHVKIEQ